MSDSAYYLDTNLIDNPGHDARAGLNPDELQDLEDSIRENGILQPILVRPRGDRFEVISGNRRLQVARKLGLDKTPALVRDASDTETAVFRFEENIKRANLNPVEEAKYISEGIVALGISVADFAKRIGRSEQWIYDRLSIAEMPDYMHRGLIRGTLSLGVCLAFNRIQDEEVKQNWTLSAEESGMTVSAAESAYNEWEKIRRRQEEAATPEEAPPAPKAPPVVYVRCVRCGTSRPMQQTKFVRICNPVCPLEEGTSIPELGDGFVDNS